MAAINFVLFDFFGTLVHYSDSRIAQGYEQTHRLLSEHGARLPYREFLTRWDQTWETFERRSLVTLDEYSMAHVCDAFLGTVLPYPVPGLSSRFRDAYLGEWNRGVRHIPGVTGMLERLAAHYRLALVTNTHHAGLVREHLRASAMEPHLHAVITSVEHGKRKPSACIFDKALAAIGGEASSALFVGDSYGADYVGATRAGLRCLLIDPEAQADVRPDERLENILELEQQLTRGELA